MGFAAAAIGAGVIGAVGSVASGVIGANAAEKASSQQVAQDQNALSAQIQGENTSLGVQAPFVDVGTGAAHELANLYGISYAAQPSGTTSPSGVVTPYNSNAGISSPGGSGVQQAADLAFTQSPNYQFAFQQGLSALDRSAAAGGTLQSGGQAKAAQEFGQGLASQQFGNYVSQLQGLANLGTGAANATTNAALSGANSQANTLTGLGTAQAAGTVGAANALGAGLTGVGSAATTSLLLSKLGGASPSAYSSPYTASQGDQMSDTLQDLGAPGFGG